MHGYVLGIVAGGLDRHFSICLPNPIDIQEVELACHVLQMKRMFQHYFVVLPPLRVKHANAHFENLSFGKVGQSVSAFLQTRDSYLKAQHPDVLGVVCQELAGRVDPNQLVRIGEESVYFVAETRKQEFFSLADLEKV